MGRARALVLVSLLGGCDELFGLDRLAVPDAASLEACPSDYVSIDGAPTTSRYRYIDSLQLWATAEADCENDSLTRIAHLVVFDDLAELVAVREHIKLSALTFRAHAGFARDTGSDPSVFFAVTGAQIDAQSALWEPSEPNNGGISGGEETIVWFGGVSNLTDAHYTYTVSSVCECDQRPVTKTFVLHP